MKGTNSNGKRTPFTAEDFEIWWEKLPAEYKATVTQTMEGIQGILDDRPFTVDGRVFDDHVGNELLARMVAAIETLCIAVSGITIAISTAMMIEDADEDDIPRPILAFQVAEKVMETLHQADATMVLNAMIELYKEED